MIERPDSNSGTEAEAEAAPQAETPAPDHPDAPQNAERFRNSRRSYYYQLAVLSRTAAKPKSAKR